MTYGGNKMDKREAIIKEVNEYLAQGGSMHYIQIGAHIEEIINKHLA